MLEQVSSTNQQSVSGPSFDVQAFLVECLIQWKWFILSVLIFLLIGNVYVKRQAVVYVCKSSVLIKQDNSMSEEMLLMQDIGFRPSKNNVYNEIGVFKSSDLIEKIVSSYNFYTTYRYKGKLGFYTPELYEKTPVSITWENMSPDSIPGVIRFEVIAFKDGFNVEATYRGNIYTKYLDTLPATIELPMGQFRIDRNESVEMEDTPLLVTIQNSHAVARSISKNDLQLSTTAKKASLLDITFSCNNPTKGELFLKALIQAYNNDATADKNMISANTAVFIDERLKSLTGELSAVEGEVESFRKNNQITDVSTEVELYMSNTKTNEERRIEIETQLNLIQYIDDFLNNPDNHGKLIPNLGISDTGLLQIINGYNVVVSERDRGRKVMTADNPVMQHYDAQIAGLSQGIRLALVNQRKASQIALNEISQRSSDIRNRISDIPTIERQYTDVLRQQVVKNKLFTFLLQKREEVSLTQAGVAPKLKQLSKPYAAGIPIAPHTQIILSFFFLLGLVVPAAIILVVELFHIKVLGMKDLERLENIPIIGDIARVNIPAGRLALQVKDNDDSLVTEMFRTLRNNLLFLLGNTGDEENKGKVIIITSTIQREGKTFVSTNLSKSISLMDKKVLLIGADLRNPQLQHAMGLPHVKNGLSTYLAEIDTDIYPLIQQVTPMFHVVQGGPVPPNPNELLSTSRMKTLVNQLKREYDYIIIDSAPVGIVSDTFVLNQISDRVVYVVREKHSRCDSLDFIKQLNDTNRLSRMCVVLNDASLDKGHYGKYNYKYNYRYHYREPRSSRK